MKLQKIFVICIGISVFGNNMLAFQEEAEAGFKEFIAACKSRSSIIKVSDINDEILMQNKPLQDLNEKDFFKKLDRLAQNPEQLGQFFKESGFHPNSYIPRPEMSPIIFDDMPDTILENTLFRASQNVSLTRMFVGEDGVDNIKAYQLLLSEMLKFVDDNDPRLVLKEKEFNERCMSCVKHNRQLANKENRNSDENTAFAKSNIELLDQIDNGDCQIHKIFSERLKHKKNT